MAHNSRAVVATLMSGGESSQTFPSLTFAADYLGLDKSHIAKVCRDKIKSTGGYIFKYDDGAKNPTTETVLDSNPPQKPEEVDPDPLVVRRLKDALKSATARVGHLEKTVIKLEDIRSEVLGLGEMKYASFEKTEPRNKSKRAVILHVTDLQYGEVISLEGTDGLNSFSPAIADARLSKYFNVACRFLSETKNLEQVIVMLGGDMLSGWLHPDLQRTDALPPLPAAQRLSGVLAGGILKLADYAPVSVYSVAGNHGRIGDHKPPMKLMGLQNYDTAVSWFTEAAIKGAISAQKDDSRPFYRIEFIGPRDTFDVNFSVFNRNYVLTHGDSMSAGGGTGFIGAGANIVKGHKKLILGYSNRGISVDKIFSGHLHTSIETPFGFGCGTLAGYSEFALKYRLDAQPPTQDIHFLHSEWGHLYRVPVKVGDASQGSMAIS